MVDVSIAYLILVLTAAAFIAAALFTAVNISLGSINRILKVPVSIIMVLCFGYLFMSIKKAGLSDTLHPLTALALFSGSLLVLYVSFGTLRFIKEDRNDDYYENQADFIKKAKRKKEKRL